MKTLEEKNRKRMRRTDVQEAILSTIAVAGVIGVGLVAPNVLSALYKLGVIPLDRKDEVIRSAASRLRKNGLVKFEDGYYSLTEAGEKILKQWQFSDYKITPPKRWDKKWRVIIFDIPEKKKRVREHVREIVTRAGFRRLQDSVWVYPYACEEVIGLMKTELGVGKYLLYLIVDQIENDKFLREEFKLLQ